MVQLGRLGFALRDRLTRAYVVAYYSAVVGIGLPDGADEVYWFEDGGETLGQATPFGTVILNRTAFARLSADAREYVLEHERGHLGRGLAFGSLYWGTFACWSLAGALAVYSAGLSLAGTPTPELGGAPLWFLLATLCFLGIWWLDELRAEYAALAAVGRERFLAAHRELRGSSPRRLSRLVYPAPATTIRVRGAIRRLRDAL